MLSEECSEVSVNSYIAIGCNSDRPNGTPPVVSTLSIMTICLICAIIIRCRCWKAVFTNWAILLTAYIYASFELHRIVLGFLFFYVFLLILLVDNEIKVLQSCSLLLSLQNSLKEKLVAETASITASIRENLCRENAEKLCKMQTDEMKFLIGNVAHDLKTPAHAHMHGVTNLRSILNKFSRLAEIHSLTNASSLLSQAFQELKNLESCDSFMMMAINRSLDFVKLSSGAKLQAHPETVDVREAVSWAIECVSNEKTNINSKFIGDNIHLVITDKHWLQENMLCLLSNAIKYSELGSEITILCSLVSNVSAAGSMRIHIEVEDNGIGIPKEIQSNLFQPFQKTMRLAGGTGLGLFSLSKRIEALEGLCGVKARSDSKDGSCFWFSFPYKPDNDASVMLCNEVIIDKDFTTDGLSVLFVDDSVVIQKTTVRLVKSKGCVVEIANNGAAALKLMEANKYDIVLMDLQMPIMDGLESVRRLRKHESRSNISFSGRQKIIGMSANAEADVVREVFTVKMDAFIAKPFNAIKFFESYNSLMRPVDGGTSIAPTVVMLNKGIDCAFL